jgi:hypothetical protein
LTEAHLTAVSPRGAGSEDIKDAMNSPQVGTKRKRERQSQLDSLLEGTEGPTQEKRARMATDCTQTLDKGEKRNQFGKYAHYQDPNINA